MNSNEIASQPIGFLGKMQNAYNKFKAFFVRHPIATLGVLAVLMLVFAAIYAFWGLEFWAMYAHEVQAHLLIRLFPILAVLVVAVAIGYSTVTFQTVATAKILTPGVLGFENIYMFIQTLILLLSTQYGRDDVFLGSTSNFILSVGLMLGVSMVIFLPLLLGGSKHIFKLLLFGMIVSTFFASLTTYMQFNINPEHFQLLQGMMFASFENSNTNLLIASAAIVGGVLLLTPRMSTLDVMSLGRENAVNLGVSHKWQSARILVICAILTAVSTALVGPLMFLGLLAANLSYQMLKTYKHKYTIPAAILISAVALFAGRVVVQHVFRNVSVTVNVPVLINLIGGIYFIFLLFRERKKEK